MGVFYYIANYSLPLELDQKFLYCLRVFVLLYCRGVRKELSCRSNPKSQFCF